MKLLSRYSFSLVLLFVGLAQMAHAQGCVSPSPPPCTFEIFDVTTAVKVKVESMCVGRIYTFEPCPGRNIPVGFVSYGVLKGFNATYITSNCIPPANPVPYSYTPTANEIGDVTISESANVLGVQFYYIRNVKVVGTPPPAATVEACPGGSAQVTITDTNYDSYSVPGFTGTIVRNVPFTVSLPAGATSLTITGKYTGNGLCEGTNTLPISVPVPQPPRFTNLTLQGPLAANSDAKLTVSQLPPGFLYSLQKEGPAGVFTDVTTVLVPPGSTSLTLPAAAGCYRIARRDYCGGSPAATPTLCTLGLTGSSALNRNQLLLTDAGSGGPYTVLRNRVAYTGATPTSTGLQDANVVCGTTYTYRVVSTLPDGSTSVSNEESIPTLSDIPPARPVLLASFNLNNVVELTPLLPAGPALPAGNTLRYRRSVGGQAPADFGTASTLRPRRDSTDLAELRAQPPCYSVQQLDVCQNASSESASTCPALLSASPADPDGSTTTLTWTNFTGPDPLLATTYLLQRLAPDGSVLSTQPVSGGRSTDLTPPPDQQVLRYRLQISGGGLPAGTFSYSNLATVTRRISLRIPTAFTPNGDGLNDVLEVKGRYLRDFSFVVVDRNGQEVFRGTQRTEAWDGRIRGHAPVPGAYVWRFQQTGEDGQPFSATGAVTILY